MFIFSPFACIVQFYSEQITKDIVVVCGFTFFFEMKIWWGISPSRCIKKKKTFSRQPRA